MNARLPGHRQGPMPRLFATQAAGAAALGSIVRACRKSGPPLTQIPPLREMRGILVVHTLELGDLVMLTPFLRELRREAPGAHITLVVKPELTPLFEICPYVDRIIAFDVHVSKPMRPLVLPIRAWQLARSHLQTRSYDLAVLPAWQADNSYASFLAAFSGARWRAAYSEGASKRRRFLNRGFDRIFTHTLSGSDLEHEVEHNLAMLRFLGGAWEQDRLELWTNRDDNMFAEAALAEHCGKDAHPLIAMCPSAGHSVLKQWPLGHFVTLAAQLQQAGARIMVIGGPGEESLGEAFAALSPPVLNMTGKTTLRQMAALIAQCDCFVGNDAGPMHVAAAMGIPTIALFGSSCHHRYGPWPSVGPARHRVVTHALPCSPCGLGHAPERCVRCIYDQPECLTRITIEEVHAAILDCVKGAKAL